MVQLKRVIYPEKDFSLTCPDCGGGLVKGLIPCPDNISGCAVAHPGYTCTKCGHIFEELSSTADDQAHLSVRKPPDSVTLGEQGASNEKKSTLLILLEMVILSVVALFSIWFIGKQLEEKAATVCSPMAYIPFLGIAAVFMKKKLHI